MKYKLGQLLLTPSKKSTSTGDIFIAQPDSTKETLAGKLFILIEIPSENTNNLKIISFLIDNINQNYYQNEKLILRERIPSLKIEHIFEAALAKTNKDLLSFLKKEKLKTNLNNINCTIGLIHKDTLHFTNTGKNKVLLIYKAFNRTKKTPHQENKKKKAIYKMSEISQQQKNQNKQINENTKLFNDVVSGIIPQKGYFVITNEALPEYLSNNQLISIVATLPPTSAIEQIKNNLSKINSYTSFMGIVIKSTSINTPNKPIKPSQDSLRQINELNKMEANTENLLAPSGTINVKQWLTPLFHALKNTFSKKEKTKSSLLLKDKIIVHKRSSNKLKNLASKFKNTKKIFSNIGSIIPNKPQKKQDSEQNIQSSKRKKLNLKNKILLTISGICMIIFAHNLITTKNNKIKIKKTKQQTELFSQIEKEFNKIDSTLLYGNENSAKEILKKTKTLISNIKQNSEEQKNKTKDFLKKYETFAKKLRKVIEIPNPEKITDISTIAPNISAKNLTILDNKLFITDPDNNSIFTLNTKTNSLSSIIDTEKEIKSLKYPVFVDNNLFYINDNSLIKLNTETEKLENNTIGIHPESKFISGSDIYHNRLYLLDPISSQIYKHTKTNTGFSPAAKWITDNTNINDAIDISIDGNIYILKNNGELIQFLKGKKQNFVLKASDPLLNNPTKLQVSTTNNNIYILEPTNKRIVIFNKESGDFTEQYEFPNQKNISDFIIDEKNKTIYILDNNKVFKTTLINP